MTPPTPDCEKIMIRAGQAVPSLVETSMVCGGLTWTKRCARLAIFRLIQSAGPLHVAVRGLILACLRARCGFPGLGSDGAARFNAPLRAADPAGAPGDFRGLCGAREEDAAPTLDNGSLAWLHGQ